MSADKRIWPGPDTAPFRKGTLLEWVHPSDVRKQATAVNHYATPDEWRPNVPFRAALTLTGTERGRSAARFTWVDASRSGERVVSYPMFMTDACALMLRGESLTAGVRDGWWIIMKRGQNYGIAAIDPHIEERLVPPVDLDRELVRACRERAAPDGLITATQAARSFNLRARPWIAERFKAAFHGQKPLPGVAVGRVIGEAEAPGTWRLTFARRCHSCDLWIPDWMPHPHPLEPAIWEGEGA